MDLHFPETLNLYIAGSWVESESGRIFEAHNPATNQVIATLPEGTRDDARRAIAAANKSKHKIADMSVWDRADLCRRIGDVIQQHSQELAQVLTQDQGKPFHTQALKEAEAASNTFYHAAEHAKWLETSFIPVRDPSKRVFSFRQPRGVYAVVTPWNFPVGIPSHYLAPALAAGNAVVWVPAPTTSVCAVKLMECIEEADVPAGVVNLVTGPGPIVGDEIVSHPGTNGVGFTGSSQTGKQIAQRAAGKPLLLELGGNGPTIVLADADLAMASEVTAAGCFFNAGQVCSATERILVQREAHDELVERLIDAAKAMRPGDPFDSDTTMGPLNNQPAAEKMDRHLADGVTKGAVILYGGQRAPDLGSDLFYMPTVIDNISTDSLLNNEETFGPVAPVMAFDEYDEALAIANQDNMGLVGAVFTNSIKTAFFFAERLRTGMVNINEHSNYWEGHIPFGGVSGTQSGIGRIGGKHTLMEMTDLRTICLDISR
jgi:succinate-semialdehyde dehydrogenase/glutarate-semialdehyde dehydrogenase